MSGRGDGYYMGLALEQAEAALREGEVPVGAVIVQGDRVVSAAYNQREGQRSALAHAETAAIARACRELDGWRLVGCTLYVTLEPCPMCAGAAVNSRIERIVYGAPDPHGGGCGGAADITSLPNCWHIPVTAGVRAGECADLLRRFFADLREKPRRTAAVPPADDTAAGGPL